MADGVVPVWHVEARLDGEGRAALASPHSIVDHPYRALVFNQYQELVVVCTFRGDDAPGSPDNYLRNLRSLVEAFADHSDAWCAHAYQRVDGALLLTYVVKPFSENDPHA